MNQNLDIFSSAILKPRNVEQNIQRRPSSEFFFLNRQKEELEVKSTKTADGFTKTFLKWPRRLIEGMEMKLVTSLFS